ncbi:SMP-30/gluconolactonase/LRE family protein [Streptosporangiaceae bacterium NEAU-GS5]|nr:SMP-30/gluconolactonase/LRE family protein [Streptosporangiaceae bacterium NEAU-GS5]
MAIRADRLDVVQPAKESKGRRRSLRIAGWSGGVIAIAVLVFVAIPSPIDPLAWDPAPAPAMTGVLTPNQALAHAELVTPTPDGPEDITFDDQGRLYTGDESGIIYRLSPGGRPERFANTGGRPNGLRFAPDGHLIVADTRRGLLSVDETGNVSVLTDTAGGKPVTLANELAVASDGTVYFSDSSATPYDKINLTDELLESRPSGRLLRYDPRTHHTDVLLNGLSLANGVALAPDQSFVLVNESFRYRITRYWLTGQKAGTHDTFADNLPGFPDNLTPVGDGTYWVALYQPRDAKLDMMQSHPFLKAQIAKLPSSLLTGATPRESTALQLDNAGRPIRALSDTTGRIYGLTTAVPHDGYLYLGTDHKGSNDVLRYHL